jgi:hypothetical protein
MGNDSGDVPTSFGSRVGLFLARFCTSSWIGAASLFVVVGISEVTRGGFDSTTKDMLVAVRFPAFYVCGAVLVSLGFLGTWMAGRFTAFPKSRRFVCLSLLICVLFLMAVDYIFIYQPLLGMVTPPGQAKPAQFVRYHEASKWINLAGLILCLITSSLVNWPVDDQRNESQP